jgi:hypothetical protein
VDAFSLCEASGDLLSSTTKSFWRRVGDCIWCWCCYVFLFVKTLKTTCFIECTGFGLQLCQSSTSESHNTSRSISTTSFFFHFGRENQRGPHHQHYL